MSDAYVRAIERRRDAFRAWLRGPESYLAAVARHELPIGERFTFEGVTIESTIDGFLVDGEPAKPKIIEVTARFRLRLSHQNFPAVVVLDSESPRSKEKVEPRWFPVDPPYRFVLPLEPDGARSDIRTTRDQDRPAERAGWFDVPLSGGRQRVAATRFLEPGAGELEVYFSDRTPDAYRMRYVPAEREGDRWVLDFNRAYDPACAYSPFYNCPLPPVENQLSVVLPVGEMAPLETTEAT